MSRFNPPPIPRYFEDVVRYVDLGMVSVRDAAIYGRSRPLIPYADGRLILGVRFVPVAVSDVNWKMWFMTPNTANFDGYAYLDGSLVTSEDTYGAITGDLGGTDNPDCKIMDCGPLITGIAVLREFEPLGTWTPNTPYAQGDSLLDPNDNIQEIFVNGVSGSNEPVWGTNPNDEVVDGTATWKCGNPVPSADAQVHAIAEIIEGVSPMPPYPATLEFIQQPTNKAHGVTLSPAITVKITDQNGDPWVFADATILLRIYGAGTLAGTVSKVQNKTTGIATFNDLSITEPHTGYVLRAELYPTIVTEPIYSNPFDVT